VKVNRICLFLTAKFNGICRGAFNLLILSDKNSESSSIDFEELGDILQS